MSASRIRRPAFHYTPEKNWMNDPNGLIHLDGEYHLFYQHNPYGAAWGHMSWGHAVSRDLVRWQHLPVALFEQPERGYSIFSGSTVLDEADTAGFGTAGRPALVAVYTADHYSEEDPAAGLLSARKLQDIHLAYSTDGGHTFTQYEDNPVLRVGDRKFGDPKVFWHLETERWVMVNILGWDQGRVVLYASPDLKSWQELSEFEAPDEVPGKWECPDLFPLNLHGKTTMGSGEADLGGDVEGSPQRWVLKVSCAAGWTSHYWVGHFDGERFHRDRRAPGVRDLGHGDCYAEITFNGIPPADGRRILVGWVEQEPREERTWTGMQSIPRRLTLHQTPQGPTLRQAPVQELERLRARGRAEEPGPLPEDLTVRVPQPGAPGLEVLAEIDPGDCHRVGFRLGDATEEEGGSGEETVLGYSAAEGVFFLERPGRRRVTAVRERSGLVRWHLLFDQGILEAFLDDGETVITGRLEPQPPLAELRLSVRGGAARLNRLELWSLTICGQGRPADR